MIGINSKEWKEIIYCIGDEADQFIKDYDATPEDFVWNWYVAEEVAKKILKEKLIVDEDCVSEINRMRETGLDDEGWDWSSFERYIKEVSDE